jgi:hypothetical protein
MFSSQGVVYSTKIQRNTNLDSKLCHPNCADGKCEVNGVYSYFRAQDCTACSAITVLKPPFGCTNEFKTTPMPNVVGGFMLDHNTIPWDKNSNMTRCLNNTDSDVLQAFKENWYFIILLSLIALGALIALVLVMQNHKKA